MLDRFPSCQPSAAFVPGVWPLDWKRAGRGLVALLMVMAVQAVPRAHPASAQEPAGDYAWKPVIEVDGVSISYIYYSAKGVPEDGVVLRVSNDNPYPVDYRFKVVFRSTEAVKVEPASGRVAAHSFVTGDAVGLYWTPFPRGISIAEIGLRGYTVTRSTEQPTSHTGDGTRGR